jgi:hypothetical protein
LTKNIPLNFVVYIKQYKFKIAKNLEKNDEHMNKLITSTLINYIQQQNATNAHNLVSKVPKQVDSGWRSEYPLLPCQDYQQEKKKQDNDASKQPKRVD